MGVSLSSTYGDILNAMIVHVSTGASFFVICEYKGNVFLVELFFGVKVICKGHMLYLSNLNSKVGSYREIIVIGFFIKNPIIILLKFCITLSKQ